MKSRSKLFITFTAVATAIIRMIRDGRELKSRERLAASSAKPIDFKVSAVRPKIPGVLRMAIPRIIWAISITIPETRVAGDQFLCPSMKPLKTICTNPMILIHGRKLKNALVSTGNATKLPSLINRMAIRFGYRFNTTKPRIVKMRVAM